MDIKNSKNKYSKTIGKNSYSIDKIAESVDFLLTDKVAYEFRTTVTKELHTPADFSAIGEWIKGAKAYYLQSYKVSEDVISPVFSGYSKEELVLIQKSLLPHIEKVEIRGLD